MSSLKAFDLVPVVSKLESLKHSSIECLFYSNTILCIGTNDGYLLRYSINKSNYSDENVEFKSVLIDQKLLNNRKPINSIVIATRLQKIIYLSDASLNMINFDDLQPSTNPALKLKNVTSICFSEKYTQESSMLCVCVRGKSIQLYAITDNEVNIYKEIQLGSSMCLQMEIDKTFICVACDDSYAIVNIADSTIQTLFAYDIEQLPKPFIAVHALESEFLLSCLGDLGMFATYDGQTTRPPIPWSPNCYQFQIYTPYVLCCCEGAPGTGSVIRVFSMRDCKQKQEIVLGGGGGGGGPVQLIRFFPDESLMLVATAGQVFALNALVSYQIDQMIRAKQTDEAIVLFESFSSNFEKDNFNKQLRNLKKRIALIELVENKNFSKCQTLLQEIALDYKEIVKLIPSVSKYLSSPVPTPSLSPQEEAYKTQMSSDEWSGEHMTSLKRMLIDYMLKSKSAIRNEEFVAVLFKLCTDIRADLLDRVEFLTTLPIKHCLQNVKILDDANRFHAHALICYLADQFENAFEIWRDLCEKKRVDETFPGLSFMIEQLSKCKDHQLVWTYVDWAMAIDQRQAVEIFTKRASDELVSERMRVEAIVESLEKYPEAYCLYLEFLVNVKNLKKEKYTTQLIAIYLDTVLDLLSMSKESQEADVSWKDKLASSREKLQNILESSNNYRVQSVLSKIKDFDSVLQKECAILYEKIEEHEKALKIFVYSLSDYALATNYCLKNSKDSLKQRKQLFNTLFSIYLNPSFGDKERLLKPTLDLLNSRFVDSFDIPRVLEMIPSNWSMKLTSDFLLNVLGSSLAHKRTNQVEKSIANTYKMGLQSQLFELKKEQLYIDDDSRCFKCQKAFDSTVVVRLPNGKLSHRLCKTEGRSPAFEY